MDFETAKAALTKLGCEFNLEYEYRGKPGVDRKSHDIPIFASVKLPFSAETWMRVARNDGQFYVGGCCGTSSAMQDLMDGWFRFAEEWVKPRDLARLAELQESHDGKESLYVNFPNLIDLIEKRPAKYPPDGKVENPWAILAAIWHLVKDHYRDEEPIVAKDHLSPLEKSLSIVERSCTAISWSRIFGEKDEAGNRKLPTAQDKIDRSLLLARFLPAFKLLNDHINDLYYGPVEGFAIVRPEDGAKAIAENRLGYCIYETREEVEKLFTLWDEDNALYEERKPHDKPSRECYTVRPVRVTLEEGIVFLDSGERYEGKLQ